MTNQLSNGHFIGIVVTFPSLNAWQLWNYYRIDYWDLITGLEHTKLRHVHA